MNITLVHWPGKLKVLYMVITRQQSTKQEHDNRILNSEFKRLSAINIEFENKSDIKPVVYQPTVFFMAEKLINTVLSNNLSKVPKFSGKGNENVIKWIKDVTNELNLLKLDDVQKLSVVQTFLLDDARRWFINNLELLKDWAIFIDQIQRAFASPVHQELAMKKVGSRQQNMDETVLHYYNDMLELFDMIDIRMPIAYKVAYLKAGLKSSIKKEVVRRNPTNPQELLEIAQAEEKLDAAMIWSSGLETEVDTDHLNAMRYPSRSFPITSRRQGGTSNTNFRCYNCNRVGHFARNCFSKNY